MPDGDSLNWKVRGKWSRTVLALVRSGTEVRLTADEAVKMFVKQCNEGKWKYLIVGIDAILARSLPLLAQEFGFSARSGVIQSIRDEVRSLVGSHTGECAKWMISATSRCVENLAESPRSIDRQGVRRELLASVVEGLLDNRVLQPVRQDLLKELGRDQSEQYFYEQGLRDATRRQAANLVSSFFNSADETPVRSPNRSVPLRATDYARLGESLTVLEGAL